MSREVAVSVAELETEGADAPQSTALTPEEWMTVRLYRGLDASDRAWMRRVLSALAARTAPD